MIVRCHRCNRPLTNPASIQIGMGAVCARKEGLIHDDNRDSKYYDTSCKCKFCGGTIEAVFIDKFQRVWEWICGGRSGDGCFRSYGNNTPAPSRVTDAEIESLRRLNPRRFRVARYERKLIHALFQKTGKLPPYDFSDKEFMKDREEVLKALEEDYGNVWDEKRDEGTISDHA